MNDEFYMGLALSEAWKFQILTYPNPAVGCLILDENGEILSCKAHEKAGYLHAEPTAILFALCKKSEKFKDDFIKAYNAKFNFHTSTFKHLSTATCYFIFIMATNYDLAKTKLF